MKQTLMLIYPFPPVLPQFSFSPLQLSSNNYSYVEIFFLGGGGTFSPYPQVTQLLVLLLLPVKELLFYCFYEVRQNISICKFTLFIIQLPALIIFLGT